MRENYSVEDLQRAVNQYGVGVITKQFLFDSGLENSNYYIETPHGRFVLKMFEGPAITSQTTTFEVEVMQRCSKAGLKVPKIYPNSEGFFVTSTKEKSAILMEFVDGTNDEHRAISDNIARELGEQMGKIDALLSDLRDPSRTRQDFEYDAKNFLSLEKVLLQLPATFDRGIFESLFALFRSIKSKYDALPAGVIHNDIVPHNIIEKDDHITAIIDFSDMAFSPYVQNLGTTFCMTFFAPGNWKPRQIPLFLSEYVRFHPLSTTERSLLYEATLIRFGVIILGNLMWDTLYGVDPVRTAYVEHRYRDLLRFSAFGKKEFEKLVK